MIIGSQLCMMYDVWFMFYDVVYVDHDQGDVEVLDDIDHDEGEDAVCFTKAVWAPFWMPPSRFFASEHRCNDVWKQEQAGDHKYQRLQVVIWVRLQLVVQPQNYARVLELAETHIYIQI